MHIQTVFTESKTVQETGYSILSPYYFKFSSSVEGHLYPHPFYTEGKGSSNHPDNDTLRPKGR